MKISVSLAAAALCGSVALSGCASTTQLDPNVSADITTAFNAICGSAGLLAAAQPFASVSTISTYYNEAVTICANGVPTNEIVAGVDIFDLYIDLSQALSKNASVAKAKALKVRAHRG